MDAEHAPDAHCVELAIVDQTSNRLRVDAELISDLTDAHEGWLFTWGRHVPCEHSQVPNDTAMGPGDQLTGPWALARLVANGLGTDEARAVSLDLGAVVRPVGPQMQCREESGRQEDCEDRDIDQASFGHVVTSFRLEADVLQGVGGLAVEPGSGAVVAASRGEVALGDPRGGAVAP